MQCAECGGNLEKKIIVYNQPWGEGKLYQFENVPALVCSQCGAIYLESKVSQTIDKIIQSRQKPIRYKRVPIYSLGKSLV